MSVVMKAKTTLTTLSMCDIALSNASFKKISQMSQLTKLEINGANIKTDGTASFANLSELKSLTVYCLYGYYYDDEEVVLKLNESVNFFSRFKTLEEVEIMDCHLNDRVVESLVVNNPNLRNIYIDGWITYLNGRSLSTIADNCPHLTHIGMGYQFVLQNDDIMQFFSKCSKLKYANFKATKIEDSALARLPCDCPDLETLDLSYCEEITEQGIELFLDKATQGKLKRLEIKGCEFLYDADYDTYLERLKQNYPNIDIIC